jgi:hypothetical protein
MARPRIQTKHWRDMRPEEKDEARRTAKAALIQKIEYKQKYKHPKYVL